MRNLILRLVINAVALYVTANVVDGIGITQNIEGLLMVALIFGLVNAIIRPIVDLLTCPIQVLTLGLITFVINALLLMLTGVLTREFVGQEVFVVGGFMPALIGSILITIISTVLSIFLIR